jgi:quinol-cytochrome oxidoreductase complex cytochrome b subunit
MVITVSLHLARVFLTGAYKNADSSRQHREWNWLIGCAMLVATVLLSFTGYLLPWDQLAFWAVTTGTNIVSAAPFAGPAIRDLLLGGREVGQAALLRFYVLHIVVLPLGMAVLFAYHMWRIRKDGGLARGERPGREDSIPAVPAVVRRIAIVTVATWLAITVLATFAPSPLQEAADPRVTPNPAKAPWYFLWVQELVTDTTFRIGTFTVNGAVVGGIAVPSVLFLLLLAWPWLDRAPGSTSGLMVPRERRAQAVVFLALAAGIVLLTIVGMMRGPSWQFFWPWEAWPAIPTRF